MEVVGSFDQSKFSLEKKEENKEFTILNTPMGDFDYDDNNSIHQLSSECSSSNFSDEIQLNSLCDNNEKILEKLANQLKQISDELDVMIRRIDDSEEDILKRRDFCRDMERLCLEYNKQIGRETEQVEKIEFLIDHLRHNMLSREEILENLKIMENNQLSEHFRKRKSDSNVSFGSDSEQFASIKSQ